MKPIEVTERQSLKHQVIAAMKQYIVDEKLTAGDKLPTERKFSEMFEVSRSVVREALSYLENTGVVRVRQGQGTFLNESNIDKLLDNFFFLWQINNGDIRDIRGLRLIFESSAIDDIVARNDETAVAALRQIVQENLQAKTLDAFREADMAFHKALLQATNNQLFAQLTDVITNYFFQVQHIELSLAEYKRVGEEHAQIVNALEKGDAAEAKAVLARHMKQAKD
ncbi:Uxu operon transcriptional regulator [Lentibacillus sp. JNUCC-1]|uniref:FadR/GntR family transcriptional regulator n=1 Tax=Lentibacillus sp. JNUCC-1 TaxID=2654513 RepID=UPI0012E989DE|nr:FadR/GntR family transcriptional regulator [Lentibacillus sp. JNUCC-1]MUV37225.1 Uxu operon transcriptional regulator [Lentibacillus sp. JNUCC-1]